MKKTSKILFILIAILLSMCILNVLMTESNACSGNNLCNAYQDSWFSDDVKASSTYNSIGSYGAWMAVTITHADGPEKGGHYVGQTLGGVCFEHGCGRNRSGTIQAKKGAIWQQLGGADAAHFGYHISEYQKGNLNELKQITECRAGRRRLYSTEWRIISIANSY